MKALSADSFLARLLGKLAAAVCRHPRWFIYPQLLLFVLCVLYTVKFLQFDTNRDDLVGANKKYQHNFLEFKKEFPQQDDLVVVVESDNIGKNRQFVERLGARLQAETNVFSDVFYDKDLKNMGAKALLLASDADLVSLEKTLQDDLPFIRQFTQTTNLVSFFEQINTEFRTARRSANSQTESLAGALPALTRIVNEARDDLEMPGTPPSPGVSTLFDTNTEDAAQSYLAFAKGKIFLVTAHAASEDLNSKAVERIRQLIKKTQSEVSGVNVGVTGEPVLEHDEMAQSQKDMTLASIVSLILCALIFIYGYNETGRPVKATLCLIIGLGYTLAYATATVGHLNILTITFVPILIGLAIDFGVHLVTRYEEELRHGKTAKQALTKAMMFTGQGIFVGALTTAGAFLAMALTNFKGIQEMGIICGGGLLVCFIPMMTMLPALLLRGRQNVIDHKVGQSAARARIENLWLQRPAIVTGIVITLCLLAATQLNKVHFDYNLLDMQSAGLPAVVFEQKLIDSADKSVLYGAVIADSLTNAIALETKIKKLPTVATNDGVESVADFFNHNQSEKLKIISRIKQEVTPLQFKSPDARPVNLYALSSTLYYLYGYLGAAADEVQPDEPALAKEMMTLRQAIDNLRKAMLAGNAATLAAHAAKLAEFQRALFDDVRETFEALQNQDDRAPLRLEDLPKVLRDRFVGVTGKLLLQVYPKNNIWQRANQKNFVEELRTIDPDVT
ncbi:MAG TPA: MMPL family transporter, partial [Verrucomicrobiae bacterium]|nr:MMPL family transporter [Verrucomicrobiae bacterium]